MQFTFVKKKNTIDNNQLYKTITIFFMFLKVPL